MDVLRSGLRTPMYGRHVAAPPPAAAATVGAAASLGMPLMTSTSGSLPQPTPRGAGPSSVERSNSLLGRGALSIALAASPIPAAGADQPPWSVSTPVGAGTADLLSLESRLPSNVVFDEREVIGGEPLLGPASSLRSFTAAAVGPDGSGGAGNLSPAAALGALAGCTVPLSLEVRSPLPVAQQRHKPESSSPSYAEVGSGPASGPATWPAPGPAAGSTSGPATWPAPGPAPGPAAGSTSGPAAGRDSSEPSDGSILDALLDELIDQLAEKMARKQTAAAAATIATSAAASAAAPPSLPLSQPAATAAKLHSVSVSHATKYGEQAVGEEEEEAEPIGGVLRQPPRSHPRSAPTRDDVDRSLTPTAFRLPLKGGGGGGSGPTWRRYSSHSSVVTAGVTDDDGRDYGDDDEDDDDEDGGDDDTWGGGGEEEDEEYRLGTTSGTEGMVVLQDGEVELLTVSSAVSFHHIGRIIGPRVIHHWEDHRPEG